MKQKFFILLGIVVLLFSAAFTLAQDEESFTLTIMHTNDVHANHDANRDGADDDNSSLLALRELPGFRK